MCVLEVVSQTAIPTIDALRLRERTKGISGESMQQNPWCSGAALLFRGVEALAGPATTLHKYYGLIILCCIGSSPNLSHSRSPFYCCTPERLLQLWPLFFELAM